MMLDGKPDGVRRLSVTELDAAVGVASRAFQNDSLWRCLLPDDQQRARLLPSFFRVFLAFGIRSGQVYGVADPIRGIVAWGAPDQRRAVFLGLFRAGFLRLLFGPLLIPLLRALRIFTKIDAMQRRYATEPHYYLRFLAVSPESQGKGLASKLIKPVLAQADRESQGVYLETMTESNIRLYEHYGFACKEQFNFPGRGISIWAFYRPAGKGGYRSESAGPNVR